MFCVSSRLAHLYFHPPVCGGCCALCASAVRALLLYGGIRLWHARAVSTAYSHHGINEH